MNTELTPCDQYGRDVSELESVYVGIVFAAADLSCTVYEILEAKRLYADIPGRLAIAFASLGERLDAMMAYIPRDLFAWEGLVFDFTPADCHGEDEQPGKLDVGILASDTISGLESIRSRYSQNDPSLIYENDGRAIATAVRRLNRVIYALRAMAKTSTIEPMAEAAREPAKRPAFARDRKFLEWYEANGKETCHSPAKIRDKWNAMNAEQREAATGSREAGQVTRDVVRKGIKKAGKERGS